MSFETLPKPAEHGEPSDIFSICSSSPKSDYFNEKCAVDATKPKSPIKLPEPAATYNSTLGPGKLIFCFRLDLSVYRCVLKDFYQTVLIELHSIDLQRQKTSLSYCFINLRVWFNQLQPRSHSQKCRGNKFWGQHF